VKSFLHPHSGFKPKYGRIAKVHVVEAIEKAEAGDPAEALRACRYGRGAEVVVKSHGRDLDPDGVDGK
jgi:hypothetical protein